MLKDSKKLLEIALNKYKETNNPEVTILYDECSEIINAGYVIPKILEELKENGLISEYSSLTIDFTMRLYLTRDGIEFFNNPQPDEYTAPIIKQTNYYQNCNVQNNTGNNNINTQNIHENNIEKLKNMILDFLNTQNIQNDELKDEMQSIVEDIEDNKVSGKQRDRWWNRLNKLSIIATLGTTACQLAPIAQERLEKILQFLQMIK
ncbi:MAG: hypothetical protein HFI81_10495 [Eubacterium sp.]|nr:hypothetical protein [Eubacterium sp.]